MSALLSALLAVLALALIGYPLLRGRRDEVFADVSPAAPSLARDKEALMNTLGEIEFDYHMKKLSDEDYQSLKANYSYAAAAILKKDEETEKTSKAKATGKSKSKNKPGKVQRGDVKRDLKTEIEAEIEAALSENPQKQRCHRCGAALVEANQEYCHSCGERQF